MSERINPLFTKQLKELFKSIKAECLDFQLFFRSDGSGSVRYSLLHGDYMKEITENEIEFQEPSEIIEIIKTIKGEKEEEPRQSVEELVKEFLETARKLNQRMAELNKE